MFYVVQPYGKNNVIGIFDELYKAKTAIEDSEKEHGFLTRWEETRGLHFSKHYDGTVTYVVSPYKRNIIMTPEDLEELTGEKQNNA